MPRKNYAQKNRYVHNANISEQDFETLVWLYIQGIMAAGVPDFYELEFKGERTPPSTKTIGKIFRRLGWYLFERLVEPRLPPIGQMKERFPEKHIEYMDNMAQVLVDFALSGMDYETWRDLKGGSSIFAIGDQLPAEVRQIYSARKGQSSDPRAVVGLADFRIMVKRRYQDKASPEQLLVIMYRVFLGMLEEQPLRLSEPKGKDDVPVNAKHDVVHVDGDEPPEDHEAANALLVIGTRLSEDGVVKLISMYLQSLSAEDVYTIFNGEEPEEASKTDIEELRKLFLSLDHFLFAKLIAPQVPQTQEVRNLFSDVEDEYLDQVASIILKTALDQSPRESRRIVCEGHELMHLHRDVAMEIKHEYTSTAQQQRDNRGLVALPTLRFFCANRLESGWEQPTLLMFMHHIVQDWLKEEPLQLLSPRENETEAQ